MRYRQQAQPIGDEIASILRVSLDDCGLVLDHLSNAGDAVVASVVIHSQLFLLILDLGGDCEVNSVFKRRQTKLGASLECVARMLSNRTNSVGRCLTQRGTSVASKSADGLHDALEIFGREVRGPQMLNHVIKDEEGKLESFLLLAAETGWDDLITQALYETPNKFLVTLEERTHQLGSRDLQIEFI